MSANYLYHTVSPENEPNGGSFGEFAIADFVLNFPQRKLVAGSIRITANVLANDTLHGADKVGTQNLYVDPLVGASAFFDTMTTTLDKVGQIESIQDYGRWIKTVEQAKTARTDLFKGSAVCELKAPNANWVKTVLRGTSASRALDGSAANADGLEISDQADFSIKPMICLNSAMGGDGSMSFRKTGPVRLTLRVARALSALYGPSVSPPSAGTVAKVALSNLRIHFASVPDDGTDAPMTMSNIVNIQSTIQSSFANISCQVPAICRAVSATVIRTSHQNAGGLHNPLACEVLPEFRTVEFIYNSTINNSLVSYQITDYAELLERYVKSVSDSDHSSTSMWEIKHNSGMGIGLEFADGLLDLRRQRFQIQISSGVNSAEPYAMSLFFWGVQTI
tara:strand:+ start:2482 stop:3660 length:1179 start_codon:yes stop_codon:yes gene_type:complete